MDKTAKTEERTWLVRAKAYVKPVLAGLLAGVAFALLLLLLFAAAMAAMHLTLAAVPWLARIVSAAGGFMAGFVAAKSRKKRGLMTGGFTGLLLGGCVLLAGVCFSGGFPVMQGLSKLLLYAAAGMLGGVLGVGSGSGKRR